MYVCMCKRKNEIKKQHKYKSDETENITVRPLNAQITSYPKLVQMVRRARLHVESRKDFRFFTAPGDLTAFVRYPVISLTTSSPLQPRARVIIIVCCVRVHPCNTCRLIRYVSFPTFGAYRLETHRF